jgi:uncharacterized membrane protein YbhN (UPF0104 family)
MSALFDAVESFFDYLGAIAWGALALALVCHLARIGARTRSWRNILAASYPGTRVRWRSVFGAYVAGVGVNAILPARGGDVLKLYLIKHRIEGSSYPTLTATLLVETLFDFVVASLLLLWALQQGVLPGVDVLDRLPSIDWLYLFQNPTVAAVAGGIALAAGFVLGLWASRHIRAFRQRVAQGFAILRSPKRYLRGVVLWQSLDWSLRLAALYFFLQAFGLPATVYNALLSQVAHSLATIAPLTPGGIGTEQALLVYLLSGEASRAAVVSFSVGVKLVLVAVNVVVGFAAIVVMLRTFRWRRHVGREQVATR